MVRRQADRCLAASSLHCPPTVNCFRSLSSVGMLHSFWAKLAVAAWQGSPRYRRIACKSDRAHGQCFGARALRALTGVLGCAGGAVRLGLACFFWFVAVVSAAAYPGGVWGASARALVLVGRLRFSVPRLSPPFSRAPLGRPRNLPGASPVPLGTARAGPGPAPGRPGRVLDRPRTGPGPTPDRPKAGEHFQRNQNRGPARQLKLAKPTPHDFRQGDGGNL